MSHALNDPNRLTRNLGRLYRGWLDYRRAQVAALVDDNGNGARMPTPEQIAIAVEPPMSVETASYYLEVLQCTS